MTIQQEHAKFAILLPTILAHVNQLDFLHDVSQMLTKLNPKLNQNRPDVTVAMTIRREDVKFATHLLTILAHVNRLDFLDNVSQMFELNPTANQTITNNYELGQVIFNLILLLANARCRYSYRSTPC